MIGTATIDCNRPDIDPDKAVLRRIEGGVKARKVGDIKTPVDQQRG